MDRRNRQPISKNRHRVLSGFIQFLEDAFKEILEPLPTAEMQALHLNEISSPDNPVSSDVKEGQSLKVRPPVRSGALKPDAPQGLTPAKNRRRHVSRRDHPTTTSRSTSFEPVTRRSRCRGRARRKSTPSLPAAVREYSRCTATSVLSPLMSLSVSKPQLGSSTADCKGLLQYDSLPKTTPQLPIFHKSHHERPALSLQSLPLPNATPAIPHQHDKPSSSWACWNCLEIGHHYSSCPHPRNWFCYGCGRRNFTLSKCPDCSHQYILGERRSSVYTHPAHNGYPG
ncbi:uncharacterized protein LOC107266849 [Cephus cinctus]|uniref:Uncharacterized protein LOC107266849 n=1 Tax=Cephus cinctus TaxID=211228 RepID=A0AAJ7BSG3_CEPCN|nr:uncharacterized protein LOC107266849 [Cephus cinctus]